MSQDDNLELLNIFAHDMKTPLSAVLHYVDLIERVGTLNDQQRKFLGRITENVDKMLLLVRDLLTFAKLENDPTLQLSSCDLVEMTQTILGMLDATIAEKHLSVSVEIAPSARVLHADARHMQQVLQNLLSNAVKYNREEGTVCLRCTDEGDAVRLVVEDTGIGIPSHALPRVFEKFYRVKQPESRSIEGTGLGLAIVKHAIEAHGGQVSVASERGKGTTFTVLLPRIAADGTFQPLRPQSGEFFDAVDDDAQEAQDVSQNDASCY